MASMKLRARALTPLLLVLLVGCSTPPAEQEAAAAWQRTERGVIVRPALPDAAPVQVEVESDRILRVVADPAGRFERPASLMRVARSTPTPAFELSEDEFAVRIAAAGVSARVAKDSGQVSFFDAGGAPLLNEVAGGRRFDPVRIEERDYFNVRQRFESPPEEAFYGTGLHQQGWMNLKGRDVELIQHNVDKAIPYLASSRGYGILWDNNSLTRYGDPRGLRPLGASLDLFDAEGAPGALSARYVVDGEQKLARREEAIDYQYRSDYERFPREAVNPNQGGRTVVTWEGSFAARSSGRHTFSLFNSEYARVWIDGELVKERWRQNWNAWHHEFALELEAGRRHALKVEWDMIDPAYIALLARDPLPPAEAGDLSIWSEAAQVIDYYFVAGGDADGVLAGYRALTGRAVLLPKWVYGFWQSRERYKSQQELVGALDEYRRRGWPIDNIVLDWSYWPEDAWGSHDFDPRFFPDPDAMVQQVHDRHAQIMISVWPKFYPSTEHYRELAAAGHVYPRPVELGVRDWIGEGYVNTFYDPYSREAQDIFWRQVDTKLNRKGFDAWWLDATEPDQQDSLDLDERKRRTTPTALGPSAEYFISYPLPHSEGVYRGSRAVEPDKRVFILSRAAFAGQQRAAAAFWSGDIVPRWEDLYEQIAGLVNASMAGVPNVSFDIGGFSPELRYVEKDPAHLAEWRELNLRWFQFGAFVPIMRLHGQYPFREIWEIAPDGTAHQESFLHYLRLRYTLLPYVYTLAGDSYHRDGTLMRALAMDFPRDPKVHAVDDQYLFGSAFLVAPVTKFGATSRPVYLPAGADWIDFDSGERHPGGRTIDASAPLQRMPVFVRAGSIVPRMPVQQYVDEKPDAPLLIEVYTGADGRFSLYEDQGRDYGYERGEFSRIDLHWNDATDELLIGARQGSYPGMSERRELRLRWVRGPRGDNGELEPASDLSVVYDGTAQRVRPPAN